MSLNAKQVLMIWRTTVQAKSPVCIVSYKSSHALIGALLSEKVSCSEKIGQLSGERRPLHFRHLSWSVDQNPHTG